VVKTLNGIKIIFVGLADLLIVENLIGIKE
jgi:hypothetical protein